MNSGAMRYGLVGLSAESAERATSYLPEILDVTWPSCHPDILGYGIYDLVIIPPTGCQVAPIAPGPTGGSWVRSIALGNRSSRKRPRSSSRSIGRSSSMNKRVDRLRLGRLPALGMADCLRAIGCTSA